MGERWPRMSVEVSILQWVQQRQQAGLQPASLAEEHMPVRACKGRMRLANLKRQYREQARRGHKQLTPDSEEGESRPMKRRCMSDVMHHSHWRIEMSCNGSHFLQEVRNAVNSHLSDSSPE